MAHGNSADNRPDTAMQEWDTEEMADLALWLSETHPRLSMPVYLAQVGPFALWIADSVPEYGSREVVACLVRLIAWAMEDAGVFAELQSVLRPALAKPSDS